MQMDPKITKIYTYPDQARSQSTLGLPAATAQSASPGSTLASPTIPRYLQAWRTSSCMLKPDLVHRISAGYAAFLQPTRTPDSVITRHASGRGHHMDKDNRGQQTDPTDVWSPFTCLRDPLVIAALALSLLVGLTH